MKKKLILASLLLVGALVGCGGGQTENSTPSSESSQENQSSVVDTPSSEESSEESEESSEENSENSSVQTSPYGTLEAPLSVSAINDLVEQLQESNYDQSFYSENIAYATGIVKSWSFNSKYSSYTLVITDGTEEFTVYSGNLDANADAPKVGDTVVASGYYVNFNGTFEFGGKDNVYPTIHSTTHNEYNVSYVVEDINGNASDKATVTNLPTKANSGSEVTFTITTSTGYSVGGVKVTGGTVTDNGDGTYTFVVTDVNEITVTVLDDNAQVTLKTVSASVLESATAAGLDGTGKKLSSLTTNDSNVSIVLSAGGSNSGKVYGTYENGTWTAANWRLYATDTTPGAFTVSVSTGIIKTIKVVYVSGGNGAELTYSGASVASDTIVEINSTEATFTASVAKNCQITDVIVEYQA